MQLDQLRFCHQWQLSYRHVLKVSLAQFISLEMKDYRYVLWGGRNQVQRKGTCNNSLNSAKWLKPSTVSLKDTSTAFLELHHFITAFCKTSLRFCICKASTCKHGGNEVCPYHNFGLENFCQYKGRVELQLKLMHHRRNQTLPLEDCLDSPIKINIKIPRSQHSTN